MYNCYCRIPPDFLVRIVREKFIDRISTVELLRTHLDGSERQYIETIALLDVPEAGVREMFKTDAGFLAHFFDCRRHALQILNGKMPDLGSHLRGV